MTKEEFDHHYFTANQIFSYEGRRYNIVAINHTERLFGLDIFGSNKLTWVRCESGEIVEP